jgi:hypothetical protein
MRYDVIYRVAGEERTAHLDAPDAAAAAAASEAAHGRTAAPYELVCVRLLDQMPTSTRLPRPSEVEPAEV